MAIVKCPECGDKVSDTARTCPHCGHAMTFGRRGFEGAKDMIGAVWSIIVMLFLASILFSCVARVFG